MQQGCTKAQKHPEHLLDIRECQRDSSVNRADSVYESFAAVSANIVRKSGQNTSTDKLTEIASACTELKEE